MLQRPAPNKMLLNQWKEGPVSDHSLTPGHGRGIFCMSVTNDSIVTGSADHGLREYNMKTLQYKRELYAKRYGHAEWVTSVDHASDGRVLSGGMDSKLCLWDRSGVKCDHIKGHNGSISKVQIDENDIAISSSYDQTLIVWDLYTKRDAQTLFGPHKDAVLDFAWYNSLLVSGDKQGVVAIWDINTGTPIQAIKAHKGGVAKIMLYSDGTESNYIVTSGINDGTVNFIDMRTNKPNSMFLHGGAINDLCANLSGMVITGSADKTLKQIDVVGGFKIRHTMKASDAVFCLKNLGNLTLAGTGDGNIECYDNDTGKCLYGFGVMSKGGVRCMEISPDNTKLVVAGDDENGLVLNYSQ